MKPALGDVLDLWRFSRLMPYGESAIMRGHLSRQCSLDIGSRARWTRSSNILARSIGSVGLAVKYSDQTICNLILITGFSNSIPTK